MNDADIIELFWSRNEQAVSAVKQKYGGLCFTVANSILNSSRDAEECVNDTYLAAWNSIPPERPGKLSAFLAKIARNKAINLYKREHSEKRCKDLDLLLSDLTEDIEGPDKTVQEFDEQYASRVINAYLHEVSENKATVFVLRYYFLFSVEEISARTGYSYSKITAMLYRMREKLRQRLDKEGIDI